MMQVLGKRLLVEMPEVEKKSAAGIILTGEVERAKSRGVVVKVGDLAPPKFEIGQEVMFSRAGRAVINEKEYAVVDCDDVFLIYE